MKKFFTIFSCFLLLILITGSVAKANVPLPCIPINPGNGHNIGYPIYYLEWDWIDGPEPDGYKVYVDQVNPPQTMVYQGGNSWYQISLELGKEYYWMVVPYNSHGDAVNVPVWSFSTYVLEYIYHEDFYDENPDVTVVNHSGSSKQWFFTGMSAVISTYDFDKNQTPVWSTMISPVIDCSDKEKVRLIVNQGFFHEDEFDSYYGKIEVFDGAAWQQVDIFEGNLQYDKYWQPQYEYNISHLADGISNLQIRFEFNSNGNWDLEWMIERIGLMALVQNLGPAELVSPANGALYQPLDVNLIWQKGSGPDPDGYKLYFGQQNPPQQMVYDGQNTQFSVSDLQYETTYFWKVVPYLDDESAEDIPVWSFTTQPEHATISQLPHLENFDNFPAQQLPFGWSKLVQSSSLWAEVAVYSHESDPLENYPWSAPNHVRFSNSGHIEAILMLYSPPVTVDMSNMRVRFYARTTTPYPLHVPPASNQIQVGVMSNLDNPNTFVALGSVFPNLDYDQYMVSFEGYTGDHNIVVFRAVMDSDIQLIYLDDVIFEEIPADPMQVNVPSSLNFGNLENNYDSASKTVSVRNWGGGTLTINPGDIYLSGVGVDAYTLHNISSTMNLQGFESFQLTLDFIPNTPGNKDIILHIGEMQVPVSANSINPNIVSFPYFENFDQVNEPSLPLGWRKFVETADPDVDVQTVYYPGYIPSVPNIFSIRNRSDANSILFAMTPLVIPGNDVEELWVKIWAESIARHDYLVVGVMSDREDLDTFQPIEKVWIYPEGGFWEYAVRIPVTQEQFYIAFTADFFGDHRLLRLDDLTIDVAPALYPVNILVKEDSPEQTPLQDVELKVLGHNPITTRQIFSSQNGQASLQLEAGTHTVFASLPGYQQKEVIFEVTSQGATVVVDMTHVIYPPFNLTADSSQPGKATLSWNDPGDVFEFRYDSGDIAGHLGSGGNFQQETKVLGSAYHYFAELHEISWYLSDDFPKETVLLWVTGLDQYGYPDVENILFWDRHVPNIDNQWNVYQLPEPIVTPNGFFIGLSCDGFISMGTDNGITHPYQFIAERHFLVGNILQPFDWAYPIETWGFHVNLLIRAHGYKISSLEFEGSPWKENTAELPELTFTRSASKNAGQPVVNVKSPVLSPWASSHVYLNDMDQPFESWVNESVFTFNQLSGGTHTAGVSTAFSTIESEIVEITFTVQQGTNVETPDMSQLKLFPNPANNVLNIVSGNLIEQVKMFDMLGRLVYYSEPNDSNIIINTTHLMEGVYLVQVISQNDIITSKVKVVR
jgi:hypothetical protein